MNEPKQQALEASAGGTRTAQSEQAPEPQVELPPGLPAPDPDDEPTTQEIVIGSPGGQPMIGVVLKRVYRILDDGSAVPADEDSQEVLSDGELDYFEEEPPFCSPVAHDNDLHAFRAATDLVIQGSAYTYKKDVRHAVVRVALEKFERVIYVYGSRRLERNANNHVVFSEPEPFAAIPVRYDLAYGGVDFAALLEFTPPALEDLKRARPDMPFDLATPFHYARNPAGVGFVLQLERYDLEDVVVPNLEYPFDPVTPKRLAVGTLDNWHAGPVPAGLDWYAAGWFPRLAYMGIHGFPRGFAGSFVEKDQGWVPEDLLAIRPLMETPEKPLRPQFFQASSPGMSFSNLSAGRILDGVQVELQNMHPEHPRFVVELPRDVPKVRLGLNAGGMSNLDPHLNAAVIRPDDREVVMVWCAKTQRKHEYTPQQYADMKPDVTWHLAG
jgi:hypothetical protein